MRKIFPTLTLLFLVVALVAGCGEDEKRFGRKAVALDKVPTELMAAAKKELPNVTFSDAWTNHEDGKEAIHSYEIRGVEPSVNSQKGKTREVRVGLDSKILEKE